MAAWAFLEHHILPSDFASMSIQEKAYIQATMILQREAHDRLKKR